jgi:hypothetical protein
MKATYKNLTIESEYKGNEISDWALVNNRHTHHSITVKNNDTKIKIKFNFWASISQPTIKTEEDLFNAFQCFISDCMIGGESFEDFKFNYSYEDNEKSEEIFSKCVESYEKFNEVSEESVYDFANELSDYIEENF